MIQLVPPDLTVEGTIAYCLEYAAKVFHCTTGMYSAWDAWKSTLYPHHDPIPTDVSVPVWFDYYTDGYRYGHVAVSVPGKGFYSSPYNKPTGHNVLSSISEIERLYGVKYVGWSEDILERRVVKKGEDMVDDELRNLMSDDLRYQPGVGADPGFMSGVKTLDDLKKWLVDFQRSQEFIDRKAKLDTPAHFEPVDEVLYRQKG